MDLSVFSSSVWLVDTLDPDWLDETLPWLPHPTMEKAIVKAPKDNKNLEKVFFIGIRFPSFIN
jgi:hypothetical protein